MKNPILKVFTFSVLFVIVTYLIFRNLEGNTIGFLSNDLNKIKYFLFSTAILSSDSLLPVPSSLIIILNGQVLGLTLGVLVSTISLFISSMIGYFIGTKFKCVKANQITNFSLDNIILISFSKFIPIISESIAITSGSSNISLKSYVIGSSIGCFLYSVFVCLFVHNKMIRELILIIVLIVFIFYLIKYYKKTTIANNA